MSRYSNFNLVYRLQKWIDTVAGQTFLNYAYSWGASIVILGALFKLTHLPGANVMLFVGMGTEVLVFFISAFDRPFDKTAEGRDMPTRLTEDYLAEGQTDYVGPASQQQLNSQAQPVSQPQTVCHQEPVSQQPEPHTEKQYVPENATGAAVVASNPQPTVVPQMSQENAEAMNEAQGNYVKELQTLVETLKKVNEQSSRLTRDSEEMENLNRTLTGISKVYEMQLKGASKQIGTIDEINAQTKKMAEQIDQLNRVYARMIEAMTVNMRAATPHVNEE